jgi:translation initiation factor 2 subunit 2
MDYEDQLDRAIEDTPDIEDRSDRFEIPDPELRPEGNVTVYENFQTTVDRLGRDEDHVLKFLQNELGTSAHIDESGRGRFTGDFRTARVTNAIEEYAEGFVRCSECGLPDTKLVDEQGTSVLRCTACGALSSVPEL